MYRPSDDQLVWWCLTPRTNVVRISKWPRCHRGTLRHREAASFAQPERISCPDMDSIVGPRKQLDRGRQFTCLDRRCRVKFPRFIVRSVVIDNVLSDGIIVVLATQPLNGGIIRCARLELDTVRRIRAI